MTDYRTLVDNRTGRVIASGIDEQYISDLQTAYAVLQDRCTALERALRDVLPYAESEAVGLTSYDDCGEEHAQACKVLDAAYALLPKGVTPI